MKRVAVPEGVVRFWEMLCGCATPANTWGVLLDELRRCAAEQYQDDTLVSHVCDHLGLTEHGIAVRGAWLTEEGTEALTFLEEWGLEWEDAAGVEFVWVSPDGDVPIQEL